MYHGNVLFLPHLYWYLNDLTTTSTNTKIICYITIIYCLWISVFSWASFSHSIFKLKQMKWKQKVQKLKKQKQDKHICKLLYDMTKTVSCYLHKWPPHRKKIIWHKLSNNCVVEKGCMIGKWLGVEFIF